MKKIDYKSGILFAIATMPGAILGSLTINYIPRNIFNILFGLLMIFASVYLFTNKKTTEEPKKEKKKHFTLRNLIDVEGNEYNYSFNKPLGVTISIVVGYLSSLLGIGGGIIHVPMMVNLLNYPTHVATATSHFVLSIMSLTGTVTNIIDGKFAHGHGIYRTLYLSSGVIVGAQIGAKISKRVKGTKIIKGLAISLGLVGLRILFN